VHSFLLFYNTFVWISEHGIFAMYLCEALDVLCNLTLVMVVRKQ